MPLFATFLGSIASALASFFARFMGFRAALKLAAYTTWLGIFTALLASVYVCLSNLYGMVDGLISGSASGGVGWIRYFFMAAGMFIPANAGAVVSCIASVWIATGIYKFQRDGLANYGS